MPLSIFTGKTALRNPVKMYPENSNLMHAAYVPLTQDQSLGKIRETFFVNQIQNVGKSIFYSRIGDFTIDDMIFEIGGKNKSHKQINEKKNGFVICDDILTGSQGTIPMYLFRFLY